MESEDFGSNENDFKNAVKRGKWIMSEKTSLEKYNENYYSKIVLMKDNCLKLIIIDCAVKSEEHKTFLSKLSRAALI